MSWDGFSWWVRYGTTTMAVKASSKPMAMKPRRRSRWSRLLTAALVAAARADGDRPGSSSVPEGTDRRPEIPELRRPAEKTRRTESFQPRRAIGAPRRGLRVLLGGFVGVLLHHGDQGTCRARNRPGYGSHGCQAKVGGRTIESSRAFPLPSAADRSRPFRPGSRRAAGRGAPGCNAQDEPRCPPGTVGCLWRLGPGAF